MGDQIAGVRAKAIEVIGLQKITSAIPRLADRLAKDANWFPRWHAARALGRLSPDSRSVVAAIEARARLEPDARVREEIATTLALLRKTSYFPLPRLLGSSAAFTYVSANGPKPSICTVAAVAAMA
jgi:HEAT repeat protein